MAEPLLCVYPMFGLPVLFLYNRLISCVNCDKILLIFSLEIRKDT